jgi:hypothetical protein
MLERCGADHERPAHAVVLPQDGSRGDRLEGLAESHVVGQQGPTRRGQEGHALHLIGIQAGGKVRQRPTGGPDPLPEDGRPLAALRLLLQALDVATDLGGDDQLFPSPSCPLEGEERLGEESGQEAVRVEVVVQPPGGSAAGAP